VLEPGINPIVRLARVFNPQLVDIENQIAFLERQVARYAEHSEQALTVGLGYRGCRGDSQAADPCVTLDLGCEMPLDTVILVPAQREIFGDAGIFPKRFTLVVSNRADFEPHTVLYTSDERSYPASLDVPALFKANQSARYVRLTVQEGQHKRARDVFGLSEIVVISKGDPVSFGAKVSVVGAFDLAGIWSPEALTDARTPFGIWHNSSNMKRALGDAVTVTGTDEPLTWTVRLDAPAPLDRIVLFPYQENAPFEVSVFPEVMTIALEADDGAALGSVLEWKNPLPGMNHMTPMVIPLHGKPARSVRVTATRSSAVGDRKLYALSEIEIWSRGKNLADSRVVTRGYGGVLSTVTCLTDGYSSEKKIIPVANWLHQLRERDRIERDLLQMRMVQQQAASNSELNAIWGASMVLGLTFLIPVFFVERRRLITKRRLDQIRKRISADLHDDIGSNLGSLSMIARSAHKQLVKLQGPEEVVADLVEMESIARESSLAMRDIVWLMERQQDSIGDLVQRLRETAGRLLREIPFTLDCESTRMASKLSLEAKRNLFLFVKESIHNILKHARASHVSIRLWDAGSQLVLEVADNGIGIPVDEDAKPVAVRKLESRACLLGGQLQISSSKEAGTRIRLTVKRSLLSTATALS
jgi:signal transduction histidine kinase